VAIDKRAEINTFGARSLGGWRRGMGSATMSQVPVRQLTVAIADVKNKRFVWRGTTAGTISSNPEKTGKALD
jgi:hypothetical protein